MNQYHCFVMVQTISPEQKELYLRTIHGYGSGNDGVGIDLGKRCLGLR